MHALHTQSSFTTELASAVNSAGLRAMIQLAERDVGLAARTFECDIGLVKRLLLLGEMPGVIEGLGRVEVPLFDIRIPSTSLSVAKAMCLQDLVMNGCGREDVLVVALNSVVVAAAIRASSTDACAVLGLNLPIETAIQLRSLRPEGVTGLVWNALAPFISPKFGLPFLEQVLRQNQLVDVGIVTLLASCLGSEKETAPLQWRDLDSKAVGKERVQIGHVDVKKVSQCERIIALGGGKKAAESLLGSFVLTAIARQILKNHQSSIAVDGVWASKWSRTGLSRMSAGALALLITRLGRAGIGVADATICAFQYYYHAMAPIIPSEAIVGFRDLTVNIAMPLSNRRAVLSYSDDFSAIYLVAETRRGDCLVGTKEPHQWLRRHAFIATPQRVKARRVPADGGTKGKKRECALA